MTFHLKKLVEDGKTVAFYLAPKEVEDRGIYICEIGSKDTELFVFAETFEDLFNKLERKDFQGTCPTDLKNCRRLLKKVPPGQDPRD
jgi:hypothetical protein